MIGEVSCCAPLLILHSLATKGKIQGANTFKIYSDLSSAHSIYILFATRNSAT